MRGRIRCIKPALVLPACYRAGLWLLAGLLSLSLVACGSGSATPASNINNAATGDISDMDIAAALYSNNRAPDSFYRESADAASYVSVGHIKSTDLVVAANRGNMPVYELSTDSADEALAWSEQAANIQPGYRQLVDSSETFLYYQFTRVDPANPQFVEKKRVFKASVLDRAGVTDSYLGRITLAAMTIKQVGEIVEYLWWFSNENNYGNAVLTSATQDTNEAWVHNIQRAKLYPSTAGGCDTIEVYDDRYTVARDSGFIRKQSTLSRIISARRDGARIKLCG